MSDSISPLAPPTDLNVPAARLADRAHRDALARGVPPGEAWDSAVSVLAGHHPAWPMSLVEREARRVIGAAPMPDAMPDAGPDAVPAPAAVPAARPVRRLPLDVLVDLSTPETPETMRAALRAESLGAGRPSPFRGAWRIAPPLGRAAAPFAGPRHPPMPAVAAARP